VNYYLDQLIQFAHNDTLNFTLIAIACLLVVFILIVLLLDPKNNTIKAKEESSVFNNIIKSQDLRAIAGDDMMVTQLDLARAYIELGKLTLAKQILHDVLKEGDNAHQRAAQHLLSTL
jgi:FimV-like protein